MKIPSFKRCFSVFVVLPFVLSAAGLAAPASWVPANWQGGPLELARRAKANTLPAEAAVRDAIADWYDPATLALLDGSPINCLLVTFGAGEDVAVERRQQQLVKAYTAEAHKRAVAVLGLVFPGADPLKLVPAAADAHLDGLVLDGEFPGGPALVEQLQKALAEAASGAVVIPLVQDATAWRTVKTPVVAVEGVSPSARNLADMGIRGAPSSEPWIESNIWLVRSFRLGPEWRPVWISYQPDGGTATEYARYVADSAVAGGRWIVALDDGLRARLRARESGATVTWQTISAILKFAEDHAEWRGFAPYGNTAVVLDAAADSATSNEYLNLLTRRQLPFRMISRAQLSAGALEGSSAVVATELDAPTEAERKVLQAFAENGGLVVAGPWWGDPPKDEPYAEVPLGNGRVAVYQNPDPESVARDMRDLLSQAEMGVVAFNVPPVITYASAGASGKPVLVQLLNYSSVPSEAITIRVAGNFKSASLYTPEAPPSTLTLKAAEGHTDIAIAKLSLWGGLLLE